MHFPFEIVKCVRKVKVVADTGIGELIGRALVKNAVSMEVGGTGGVAVVTAVGKHELLGRMHVDVCEGKAMEDSIRGVRQVWVIIVCTNIHSYRRQRRGVEISFVQQIGGGDTYVARVSKCNH